MTSPDFDWSDLSLGGIAAAICSVLAGLWMLYSTRKELEKMEVVDE